MENQSEWRTTTKRRRKMVKQGRRRRSQGVSTNTSSISTRRTKSLFISFTGFLFSYGKCQFIEGLMELSYASLYSESTWRIHTPAPPCFLVSDFRVHCYQLLLQVKVQALLQHLLASTINGVDHQVDSCQQCEMQEQIKRK